ncbi:glycosyltransferase family 8 protein [Synechococcus sp. CCY 0621]|uniref:glycosyltransferase family 8 protein n=1 Tax=Synechococcus sp. CCY 0621 TaxID=2815603 RepID=UPI001C22E520|nr:glycosyltransferase family 8 protein [Synechococcus sp. CCY 0621]
MNIVCTFDDNYLPHVATMLTTLRTSNPHHRLDVSLIHLGRSLKDASMLYQYVASIIDRVSLIQLDGTVFRDLPLTGYLTAAAYARLALPDVLPAGLDRVLYLDPDIAVVGDLQPLYESDLKGYPLGAVPDYYEHQESRRLCLRPGSGYFNSGVLLVDLQAWRTLNLLEIASIFLRDHPERILYADQDVLNHQYQGNWLRIEPRWNYQTMSVLDDHYHHPELANPVKPSIVHFVGPAHSKPWHVNCVNPYCTIFRQARSSTPWAQAPLTGGPPSLSIRIKSRIKKSIALFSGL